MSDALAPPPAASPRLIPALAVAVLLSGLVALAAFPRIERYFLTEAAERAAATLSLTVEGLNGALRRYAPLPALVAERPDLAALLRQPENTALQARINEDLRQTAYAIGASDVYLMDISGLTLAASSYRKTLSFVGRSFSYRPYFTQALDGGLGRYFALGTTSGERGYFYAAPVEDNARITGVVAVKFTVDGFEETWRAGPATVLVRDLQGVVFMSSRPDWHFRALAPLTDAARARIEAARQYPLSEVTHLPTEITPLSEGAELWSIATPGGEAESYVARTARISDAGWDVTILLPTAPARQQALQMMAIAMLLTLLLVMAAAIYQQRRARLLERMETQRAAQAELEARVTQRTADLNLANRQLQQEVVERRQTEQRLRKTQAELVQAGKLAALGQMSAALSHEFNQPLAAVKSYAENAMTFLDRDRVPEARENVTRISAMTDRMASISKHLRNFARRPQEEVGAVRLDAVIEDALSVMQVRLKQTGAAVDYTPPASPVWVRGGHVRLQQVVVNLLSNALDAMTHTPAPRVTLRTRARDGAHMLEVRDIGPGIAPEAAETMFDPFFTTKAPGGGLGLGLSISYNIVRDFDGTLEAENAPGGGAVFRLVLPAAAAPRATGTAAE
ncbi:ATP-binding protein [Dinoroseobacter sp. PD6]|uniref:ATP-binding protein n=1 Tax=Dinoroseobacter sp. PD6 TaxID=3028384 RepID=UPI00237AD69D|nr:ATP-binding protein [Dinoroseobacter sp. PD6]MDD9716039.1 ATP-binding protein [Dinoroseobacter sp. PD6]